MNDSLYQVAPIKCEEEDEDHYHSRDYIKIRL